MFAIARSRRSCPDHGAAIRVACQAAGLGAGWLLAGLLLGGCGPPPSAGAPPAAPVKLAVVNLCDRDWEIVLTPAAGAARRWRMKPGAWHEESLPAGEYRGEQLLLTSTGNLEAKRTFAVRLEAGRAYRWRLATLRSATVAGEGVGRATGAVPP